MKEKDGVIANLQKELEIQKQTIIEKESVIQEKIIEITTHTEIMTELREKLSGQEQVLKSS